MVVSRPQSPDDRSSAIQRGSTGPTGPPPPSGFAGSGPTGTISSGGSPNRANIRRSGARAHPHYQDRHEEYMLVTREDLTEVRAFGWMQQSLFGAGTFFFSGAFWLIMELLAHELKFTAWIGMCLISMAFGGILLGIGFAMFMLRQNRLNKYFSEE